MKKEWTLVLVVLFVSYQAVCQQQTRVQLSAQAAAAASRTNNAVHVTTRAPKPKLHLLGPAKSTQNQKTALQIEGLDTRAWTTVAETRTSRQAFPDGENHQAGLCLFWWGTEPQTQK